jgi:hypothetical protein
VVWKGVYLTRVKQVLKPQTGGRVLRFSGRARNASARPENVNKQASEFELLVDGTIALQRARVIARAVRDIELLYLVDMAAIKVSESLNRQLRLNAKIDDSWLN